MTLIFTHENNDPVTLEPTETDALSEAASQLQAYFLREEGSEYAVADLEHVLDRWLELSMERLLEDVLFHVVEGDRAYAFNRRAFELQMEQIQPRQTDAVAQPDSEKRHFAA
jgi:hypothetical protein